MDALQFKKSAFALHLVELNAELKTDDPQPGALIIFDHGHGLGHVAMKTGPNTSIAVHVAGRQITKRDARVRARKYDREDPKIAGYVRLS